MIASNIQAVDGDLRELSVNEIDAVDGGFLPLLIMAFAVGFDIGFITTMALAPTGLE
jgi:hypothetical protein